MRWLDLKICLLLVLHFKTEYHRQLDGGLTATQLISFFRHDKLGLLACSRSEVA
jgi:uncharacterized protein YbgA (DUF1722 family)